MRPCLLAGMRNACQRWAMWSVQNGLKAAFRCGQAMASLLPTPFNIAEIAVYLYSQDGRFRLANMLLGPSMCILRSLST